MGTAVVCCPAFRERADETSEPKRPPPGTLLSARSNRSMTTRKSERTRSPRSARDRRTKSRSFVSANEGVITDSYELCDKLGKGASGIVSKAVFKSTGAIRAVKVIRKKKQSSEALMKLWEEIEIMKTLDHPNIIRLYETYVDESRIFMVMELCRGGELFDRIVQAGSFFEKQAAILMKQIFHVVYYMHGLQVCHRDLKPDNFMLASDGPICDAQLKLIDFGLSRDFGDGKPMTSKVGTTYYLAPEIYSGKYTEAVDLWSCGVIMYILLAGIPPFSADSVEETTRLAAQGRIPFGEAFECVTEDAKQLIQNLIRVKPMERYTAEEALRDGWVRNSAPRASVLELDPSILDRLQSFRTKHYFFKAVLYVIARQIDTAAIKSLRDSFQRLDADGDGMLTVDELTSGFAQAGADMSSFPIDLDKLLTDVDVDGSGVIDYTEFVAATLDDSWYTDKCSCQAAFRLFDKDQDGFISPSDIETVLNADEAAIAIGAGAINDIFVLVDSNGDGNLGFDEFMAMMRLGDAKSSANSRSASKEDTPSFAGTPLGAASRCGRGKAELQIPGFKQFLLGSPALQPR